MKTSRNSTNLEILRQADELYAQREQIENVCQSIEILRGSAGEHAVLKSTGDLVALTFFSARKR